MRQILLTIILSTLATYGCYCQTNDSIQKIESKGLIDIREHLESKQEAEMEKSKNNHSIYITALVGLLGVIITATVTYQVAIRQNKSKLIETKLAILNSRMIKLESVKTEIYDRRVDVSNGMDNSEQAIFSRYVDKLLLDINSTLRVSEYLDADFISKLKSYSKRLNAYIQNSKTGNSNKFDTNQMQADIEQISIMEEMIKTELDAKLRGINSEIEKLLKGK